MRSRTKFREEHAQRIKDHTRIETNRDAIDTTKARQNIYELREIKLQLIAEVRARVTEKLNNKYETSIEEQVQQRMDLLLTKSNQEDRPEDIMRTFEVNALTLDNEAVIVLTTSRFDHSIYSTRITLGAKRRKIS